MNDVNETWNDFEKTLNITVEDEEEIRLEMELIKATIEVREKNKLSQTELSKLSGIKQSAIARMEKSKHSPTTSTLIKLLYPMGYTLKIVPIKKK